MTMDIDDALAWNTAQGNAAWIDLTTVEQGQMLNRASNYIAIKYRIKPALTTAETAVLALARYTIALDLATNPASLPSRYTGQVIRELKDLNGLKKQTDYATIEGQIDPYPDITTMLAPITLRTSQVNYAIGFQYEDDGE